MTLKKLEVVVADGDPLARRAIVDRLERSPGIHVAAECPDGPALVHATRLHAPDVIIANVWLRDVTGIAATPFLLRVHPGVRILLISSEITEHLTHAVQGAGAERLFAKADLLECIVEVLTGNKMDPSAPSLHNRLSEREAQVAELVAAGLRNADIGLRLGLSINSVKTYTSRIYNKLEVGGRVELVQVITASRPRH